MHFSTVLFDLDGTLTDPGEGIVKSIVAALDAASLPTPSLHELRRYVGPPLQQSFLDLGAAPDQVDRLVETYRATYRETGMFENVVYPGVPELLDELTSLGCVLFVATSKPTSFAEEILEHFRLRDYFRGVFGARLDGRLADKRELIAHIRESIEIRPPETAMVGDRKFDIMAGRAESLFSVGVLWGYGSRSELEAAQADALAAAPSGLLDVLAEHPPTHRARLDHGR